MNIFYNSRHNQHRPPSEIFNGNRDPHQEVPARVEQILKALKNTDHQIIKVWPSKAEWPELIQILKQIHCVDYVNYLQSTEFSDEYVYPSVFSYRNESVMSAHPVAQRGLYSFDTYTPVNKNTFMAAAGSAFLAQHAATEVLSTHEPHYALCRPPGHHAEPSRMGGYCYFNNGAVAAQVFRQANPNNRVAILDLDFHHGNGTEKIFAETASVLTISIHADPDEKFPFFSGKEANIYTSNHNFPLPLGTNNDQYAVVLQSALKLIGRHSATHLVVCFGADTHESDPIGGFRLTTDFYTTMAQQINQLAIPTVIVQEGGYNNAVLGKNIVAFLSGFNL